MRNQQELRDQDRRRRIDCKTTLAMAFGRLLPRACRIFSRTQRSNSISMCAGVKPYLLGPQAEPLRIQETPSKKKARQREERPSESN